jgi:hypothetical protein
MPELRLLGDGWEPHVYEDDGKLTYTLPVSSSVVTLDFSFDLAGKDLDVLLADPFRRAVLEVIAHTVLQRSMIRGNPKVTQEEFDDLVARVLHGEQEALERYIGEIDREYKTSTRNYVEQAMARRAAPGT